MKEHRRNIISRLTLLLALLLLLAAGGSAMACKQQEIDLQGYQKSETATDMVAIVMRNETEAIIIELRPDKAPKTVANFQDLVGQGFYDGLTFHRVVADTLIQGGDPEGTGMGGPGYTIVGEFSLNRISNDLNHERGSVSMARGPEYDSAGSQFFICLKPLSHLDREFAVFGRVIAGMDVVEKIAAVPNSGSPNNRPNRRQVMDSVFFVTSGDE